MAGATVSEVALNRSESLAPTVLVLICNTAVLGMCSHSNHDALLMKEAHLLSDGCLS